jgi:orotate phosphoribosyltransferase
MTMGADPIAYSIAYASASTPNAIRAFTVRKEPKAHGTQQLIEGPITPADSVVIVEDVLTTGGSALRATRAVQAFGARIVGVLAVVDREQGGSEALGQAGLEVKCLTKVSDILSHTS